MTEISLPLPLEPPLPALPFASAKVDGAVGTVGYVKGKKRKEKIRISLSFVQKDLWISF